MEVFVVSGLDSEETKPRISSIAEIGEIFSDFGLTAMHRKSDLYITGGKYNHESSSIVLSFNLATKKLNRVMPM